MLQADRSAESAGRLENLAELTRAMEEYESLGAFLEHVSLVMDNDEARQGERVTIMTIHAAKGLEFDTVYLAGWEEGVFPSQRSLDEGGLASSRRGTPPRLCRDHPRPPPRYDLPRRQSPHLRPVDQLDPVALSRRAAQGAHRRRNHDDRRRKPVARAMVGTRRSIRASRPRAIDARQHPRPGLAARRRAAISIPSRSESSKRAHRRSAWATRAAPTSSLGQRVFHGKFGYGTIAAIEGNKLEIDFEHAGRKKVLDSFVSPG